MKLAFTCTFYDHVEATRVHRRPARGQRTGLGERLLFLWILLGIFALVFLVGLVEAIHRGGAHRGVGPRCA